MPNFTQEDLDNFHVLLVNNILKNSPLNESEANVLTNELQCLEREIKSLQQQLSDKRKLRQRMIRKLKTYDTRTNQ